MLFQRFVYPSKNASTALAQARPSAMAAATREAPRRTSPAVNTFPLAVPWPALPSRPFSSSSSPKASARDDSAPVKPAAMSRSSAGRVYSWPAVSTTTAVRFPPSSVMSFFATVS